MIKLGKKEHYMTKNVRIENADINIEHGVVIIREFLDVTGNWVKGDEWHLYTPCEMLNLPVYSASRLVITEIKR